MQYLYEKLKERGLDPRPLSLDLVYSVEYKIDLDRLCGTIEVTYRPVEKSLN